MLKARLAAVGFESLLLRAVGPGVVPTQHQDLGGEVATASFQQLTASSPLVLTLFNTPTLIVIVFISIPLTSLAQRCKGKELCEVAADEREVGQFLSTAVAPAVSPAPRVSSLSLHFNTKSRVAHRGYPLSWAVSGAQWLPKGRL